MDEHFEDSQKQAGVDEGQASDSSIVRAHAQIRREKVAGSPVAFFTALGLIVVLVFSWFYFRRYMADYDPNMYLHDRGDIALYKSYEPPVVDAGPVDPMVAGAKLYATNCAACHQPEGQGMAGMFPPLAGSEWVTEGDGSLIAKIVISGISGPITVMGESYNGMMPGLGAALSDADIAHVATYIRGSWGNDTPEVTEEQVAAIRSETAGRGVWTAAELRAQ
ncbi:MAG: cytochrome c [Verrucomicrobiota bacterium]